MSEIRKVSAARGLAWFSGSLVLLKAQLTRLMLIGLVFQFLMGLTQFGALGILMVLSVPALTAGVLNAMSLAALGLRPPLMTLFIAFSSPERLMRLFLLSAVMIVAGMLSAGLFLSGSADMFDQDLLTRLERGDIEALSALDPALVQRLALAILAGLMISGSIAFFAVPLIWFNGLGVGNAILDGLVGMLKNWLAFLVLALLLALVSMPVALIMVTTLASAAGAGGASTLMTLLMLLVMVAYQLLLFGTQLLSFREIFGMQDDPAAPAPDDDQLVA